MDTKFEVEQAVQKNDIQHIKDALDKILQQTTKTNGRVNRLELWRSGIVAVMTFVVVAIGIFSDLFR